MINTPTVFVVGAGAGVPYGFPVGDDLSRKIIEQAGQLDNPQPSSWKKHFEHYAFWLGIMLRDNKQFRRGPGLDEYLEMVKDLRRVSPFSIDGLVQKRPEYEELAHIAIATALLPYERTADSTGSVVGSDRDWIGRLAIRLFYEGMDGSPVRFITFNYDRLIEHRLTLAVAGLKGLSEWEAWSFIKKRVDVIHVYGKLGEYNPGPGLDQGVPFETYQGDNYKPDYSGEIRKAAEGISLSRAGASTDDIDRACRALQTAEQIFWMGFSFDRTNVENIGTALRNASLERAHHLVGLYDSTESETNIVKSLLVRHFPISSEHWRVLSQQESPIDPSANQIETVKGDALALLRHYAERLL